MSPSRARAGPIVRLLMGKRGIAQAHRTGNTHIYGIPLGGAMAYCRCYRGGRGACKSIGCWEALATWHARADCPGALALAHKGGASKQAQMRGGLLGGVA
jgi:hypothetical protein